LRPRWSLSEPRLCPSELKLALSDSVRVDAAEGSAGTDDSAAVVSAGAVAIDAVAMDGAVLADCPEEDVPLLAEAAGGVPLLLDAAGGEPLLVKLVELVELWPPLWAALMASMSALLRIVPAPLMPRRPASCFSSGNSIELRPPARCPVVADASAAVVVASEISVT
jgi:hypothetical protein